MKPTVPRPVRQGRNPLSDDDTAEDAFTQTRSAANQTNRVRATFTTAATGLTTAAWTDREEIPFRSAPRLKATINGRSATGARFFAHQLVALFFRASSPAAAVQVGATQECHPVIRSDAALVATLGVDAGNHLFVAVNDGALATIDWELWIEEYRR